MSNPLIPKWTGPFGGVPPFDRVKVEHFKPALETAMAEHLEEIERIAADPATPTFENTFAALERAGRTLDRVGAVYNVFASTMRTPDFQEVEREMEPKLAAHRDRIVQNARLFKRIHADNPSCWFLKHEDWPGLDKISQLKAWVKSGEMRPLPILVGNNALFLDFEMERGADGANTGYCFPDMLVDVVNLSKAGKRDEAHDLFDAHLPLIRYEQQPGPGLAVRKYVMMRRGIIASDTLRKPGAALSPAARAEVDYLLSRVARVDARARV